MTRAAFLLLCLGLIATPALAGEKRVYKIDSVIVTRKGNALVIAVKGAVQTGGWTHPRLHVLHNDGHTVTAEFAAAAPPPSMTVIEALVPVAATAQVKARRTVIAVRVMADANEITSQVLR